jgi:hypothetical protein
MLLNVRIAGFLVTLVWLDAITLMLGEGAKIELYGMKIIIWKMNLK